MSRTAYMHNIECANDKTNAVFPVFSTSHLYVVYTLLRMSFVKVAIKFALIERFSTT